MQLNKETKTNNLLFLEVVDFYCFQIQYLKLNISKQNSFLISMDMSTYLFEWVTLIIF